MSLVVDWASPKPSSAPVEPDAAIALLSEAVDAFERDGDEEALRRTVGELKGRIPLERLHEVFGAESRAGGERQERAADLVAAELGYERRGFHWRKLDGSGWIAVVEPELDESYEALLEVLSVWNHHLRQIVERCRGEGAEVLFLTYPHQFEILDPDTLEPIQPAFPHWAKTMTFPTRAILRAGMELDVPVIETLAPMQARAEGRDHRELFVDDAHCTAAGYRVLAELVAERLVD